MLIKQRSCARTALIDSRDLGIERLNDKAKSAKKKKNLQEMLGDVCVRLAKAGTAVTT